MSQKETQKRRRVPPLSRLAWPSPSQSQPQPCDPRVQEIETAIPTFTNDTAISSISVDTKSRRVTFDPKIAPALWTEKHTPGASADLAVAPAKVKTVSAWMQCPSSKLLILVGKPGIGKSTMVRLLAKELAIDLLEWNETTSSSAYDDASVSVFNGPQLEQQAPLASFERFLRQTAPGFASVVSQNTFVTINVSATKRRKKSSTAAVAVANPAQPSAIILLDDLPNLHGQTAELNFRNMIQQFILSAHNVPAILIYSHVVEGKHKPEDLERLVDKAALYSTAVNILHVPPPTSSRMRKALEGIAKRERLKISSSSSSTIYDEWHTKSAGDLRFAIMTLQFEGSVHCRTQSVQSKNKGSQPGGRDEKLSTFHALGKLLYAKRESPAPFSAKHDANTDCQVRPSLEFIPEQVVEQCDMDLGGAVFFLQYHAPSFFDELTELADALDCYSDTAYLLDRPLMGTQQTGESIFPRAYAGSLASRAVATFNRHPAAGKFRQFHAPRIFEVLRERDATKLRTRELMHQWSRTAGASDGDAFGSSVFGVGSGGSTASFVADCLPFIRCILPAAALPFLPTSATNRDAKETQLSREQQEHIQLLDDQKEVLQMDDIDDFDSGDEEEDAIVRPHLEVLPAQKRNSASSTSINQRENILN